MCSILLFFGGLPSLQAQTSPKAYGILLFDQQTVVNRLVSFPFPGMRSFETIRDLGSLYLSAGVYYDGYYYAASNGYTSNIAEALLRFDLETGEYSEVGKLSGFPNKISDMTYDYSTNTCYAISGNLGGEGELGSSGLYIIDLTTAQATKVADMDNYFFTLACSYGGQLYGVTKYGNLASINKVTGATTVIGDTEIDPNSDNSMEFDHTDKTLWWAANTMTGDGCLCKVNVETGLATIISSAGGAGDASVAGLYIPFTASADGTPQAVGDLTITPDANGACRAQLQWVNPTEVFGGGELTAINSVDIYRNDQLVASLTGMNPGETASYTDEIDGTTGLLATYEVVAVNDAGRGVVTEREVFVGEDLPGAPENVTIAKVHPDEAKLTWEAPSTGANGGWYDHSTLVYNVVRQPDGTVLAEGLDEPTYTDSDIATVATYTYEITAATKAGAGTTATSESMVLGPGNTLPYSCGFATADERATWTIIDADSDGRTWTAGYTTACMQYNNPYNSSTPSDDWLVSHDFELEAGKNYRGTFSVRASSNQKLRVCVGQGAKVEDMTQVVYENEELRSSSYTTVEYTFSVEEDGIYNIGFYTYSDARTYFLYLTDVTLEEVADNNLAMTQLTGPKNAVAGNSYTYHAELSNKGMYAAASYEVMLKDVATGDVLARSSVAQAIEPGATATVELAWTPQQEGEMKVLAEVAFDADEITSDNVSNELDVTVLPAGSADFVEIGTVEGSYNRDYLFNVYENNSAALNVYTPAEIGMVDGVVESFIFTASNGNSYDATGVAVKVYMANTDLSAVTTWIPEDEMTLVYEGTIDIPQGVNEITLPLQEKFYFEEGKNLAILTTSKVGQYYNSVSYPYFSAADSNSGTYYWSGSYSEFDFTNYGNTKFGSKASVTLQMRCNGVSIAGCVTDADGLPMADAEVRIVERNISTMTDASGNYELKYVPTGDYTVTIAKQDYATVTKSVSVTGDADIRLDVALDILHSFSVSGTVCTLDNEPITGAVVKLSGYADLETTTDEEGAYNFETVYAHDEPYILTATKEWFTTVTENVQVVDGDVVVDNLKLEYLKYAPVNVAATATDNGAVEVKWQDASCVTTLRVDGGEVDGNIGISNGNENTVIGTIYNTPMALTEISWYQTLAGGPHYYVNLFVLALDDEGNPTNEVLYTAMTNATDDQWNTYTLPNTIFAPNGCVLGLSYSNGYLGIGLDGGKDLSYPFKENTHVFAANYVNGEFDFIESRDIRSNLMIRANGYRLADNGGAASMIDEDASFPDFCNYMVWRVESGKEADEQTWTLLTATPQPDMTITDNLTSVPAGLYAYAVKTVYPDGEMSQATFSPLFVHDMMTTVTVNVKSNSEGEGATGAVVALNGTTHGDNRTATVDASGAVTFEGLVKDIYNLTISLAGYETIQATADFSQEDTYETEPYMLAEVIVEPVNLKVESVGDSRTSVLFSWNTTEPIEEDFEQCEDFAINPAGSVDWSYVDGDGCYTYGFSNISFEGMTEKMAFIAFNPSQIEVPEASAEALKPHSGQKYLASFVAFDAANGRNDDWLISPELAFARDFAVSFYAKSFVGVDMFSVGYSTVENPTTDDFTWIAEDVATTTEWTEYSYTVPVAAKHVAIRNVSFEGDGSESYGFILMIDDVRIGDTQTLTRALLADDSGEVQTPAVKYNVYLDGDLVGETDGISYQFDNLSLGQHTAGVSAVYFSGESEVATIEFDVNSSGIDDVYGNSLRIYPNPARDRLNIDGQYTRLVFSNMSGAVVMTVDGKQETIDVSSLPAGLYILTVIDDEANVSTNKKVTIVR